MRNKIILIVFLLIKVNSYSQNVCSYVSTDESYNLYEIINSVKNTDDEISEIVERIVDKYGGASNFILQKMKGYGNCSAFTEKGLRYILYDRDFLQYQMNISETNYWAVIFIIAHEIGHHINGHARSSIGGADNRNMELEADRFAGFIFKKLGGNRDDLSKILDQTSFDLFSYNSTHPAKIDRITVAYEGFDNATNEIELEREENLEEVGNALVMRLEQLSKNVEQNTVYKIQNEKPQFEMVNENQIRGKAFKGLNGFSSPQNWWVSATSNTYYSDDKCYIFKQWVEDFVAERVPAYLWQNPYFILVPYHAHAFVSYDNKGENAFVFKIYGDAPKGMIKRQKKLFDVKKKVTNVSNDIFPENVWTNKERTKFLYQMETGSPTYPFVNTFIDIEGYKNVYECMSEEEKSNYLNPEFLIKFLQELE